MSLHDIKSILKKESYETKDLWNETDEKDLKERKKVWQQWEKTEQRKFQKRQKKLSFKKNVNKIIRFFSIFTIIAVTIPFIPNILQFSHQKFAEHFPEENTSIPNSANNNNKKAELVKKLKEIQRKKQACQKNTNIPCHSSNEMETLNKQVNQIVEKKNKHYEDLQKVIDISDGKNTNMGMQN